MQYDYLVIGGGHNGLIAANYLAKAGVSVLVLEQRPYLGGMAASQPHVPAAPRHYLSKGAIDSVFIRTTPIIDELALTRHGLSLIAIDPGYGWVDPDGETLCIFQDVARTAADIARFSKADARQYQDLQHAFLRLLEVQLPLMGKAASTIGPLDWVKATLRVLGDRAAAKVLRRLAACSAHEAIAATFESDPLRSLYAYWCEIAAPADIDGSGLTLISMAMVHKVGCKRPAGSMGAMIAALERSLGSLGGAIRIQAEVAQILVDRGAARGVRLADGSRIEATHGILASCAPQATYTSLLGTEHQTANSRARVPFMPANAGNMCPFKVDMALGGRLSFRKAQQKRDRLDGTDIGAASLMTGSFEAHLEHAAALRSGRMGKQPPIWMTVLSHADRSIAPEAQGVAYLYTSAPAVPEGGWQQQAPCVAERLIADAGLYLEGLASEIGRCVTTPADFEQQYGTPRGCLYHVDMLPTRMLMNRPAAGMADARGDVRGLYLAGSGSHPGGGVFGMPGLLAARAALQDRRA